nr:MAG TPA: hypothetical protein [Caudoviricetes sp.]
MYVCFLVFPFKNCIFAKNNNTYELYRRFTTN